MGPFHPPLVLGVPLIYTAWGTCAKEVRLPGVNETDAAIVLEVSAVVEGRVPGDLIGCGVWACVDAVAVRSHEIRLNRVLFAVQENAVENRVRDQVSVDLVLAWKIGRVQESSEPDPGAVSIEEISTDTVVGAFVLDKNSKDAGPGNVVGFDRIFTREEHYQAKRCRAGTHGAELHMVDLGSHADGGGTRSAKQHSIVETGDRAVVDVKTRRTVTLGRKNPEGGHPRPGPHTCVPEITWPNNGMPVQVKVNAISQDENAIPGACRVVGHLVVSRGCNKGWRSRGANRQRDWRRSPGAGREYRNCH